MGFILFTLELTVQGQLMLNVLHSFYKPICLTLLVVLGLACGHLSGTLLQMSFRPQATLTSTNNPSLASSSEKMTSADLNLILQNNVFDSNNRSSTAFMTPGPGSPGMADDSTVSRTDLKLFGTVVAAERSQALLQVDKELKLYHLDDEIPGGGIIETIRRNQVEIRNRDQSLTTLSLHETAPPSRRSTQPGAEEDRNATGGIKAIGENRWVISRNTIESVRENFADQLRLAQMQPRTVNGKTDGFLVRRINPRSIMAKVGLRRGDVIIDVNNIKLDSPEKGLQVFQQLREARQITLAVERDGQPMSFAYEIE
jgi:general secretion pathway protein C